jgi:hypothetical protein
VVVEVALVAAAVMVCGIGVSAVRAFRSRHVAVARKLAAAERIAVADFPDGAEAMIVGRVVVGQSELRGPLTDAPCVYFRLLVERHARVGQEPEVLLESGEGVDFLVEDDSGCARVRVAGATVSLVKHPVDWREAVARGIDAQVPADRREGTSPSRMSFFEGRLDEGELVAVRGKGRWEIASQAGVGAGYRKPPQQLVLRAPLAISDRPFDSAARTTASEAG